MKKLKWRDVMHRLGDFKFIRLKGYPCKFKIDSYYEGSNMDLLVVNTDYNIIIQGENDMQAVSRLMEKKMISAIKLQNKRVRNRKSYELWRRIYNDIHCNSLTSYIYTLKAVYLRLSHMNMFGSLRYDYWTKESLIVFISDLKWDWGYHFSNRMWEEKVKHRTLTRDSYFTENYKKRGILW